MSSPLVKIISLNSPLESRISYLLFMNVNFAERAHNHNWKLDPIVRSLLDTDFYKLLMLQFIWKNFPNTRVTSEVHNRTARVRLADRISASALRDQLEHVRSPPPPPFRTRLAHRQHLLRHQTDLPPRLPRTGSSTTSASPTTRSTSTTASSSSASPASGPRSPCGRSTPSPSSAR